METEIIVRSMGKRCGYCAKYWKRPDNEDYCLLTGKVVPFLAERDCFQEKVAPNANLLSQNANMENTNITLKVCKVCGRELPIDQFRPNPKCKDGHLDTCYDCLNKKIENGRKKNEGKEPEQTKVTDPFEAHLHKLDILMETSDQELVNELRERGWIVKCTKTIEL